MNWADGGWREWSIMYIIFCQKFTNSFRAYNFSVLQEKNKLHQTTAFQTPV